MQVSLKYQSVGFMGECSYFGVGGHQSESTVVVFNSQDHKHLSYLQCLHYQNVVDEQEGFS